MRKIFHFVVEISQNVVKYGTLEAESSILTSVSLDHSEKLQSKNSSPIAIILYTSGSTGVPKGKKISITELLLTDDLRSQKF